MLVFGSSCRKDDEELGATVNVKVTEGGKLKSGVTVHMFDVHSGPTTVFYTPFYSDKQVVTESDGVARFDLQEKIDLEAIDNQTTLYFAVFSRSEHLLGETAVTIKKGEERTVSISYN